MDKDIKLEEAMRYFRQPGFARLFEGLRERYCSLGHVGGKVVLKPLKNFEKDTLEGFLQMDCHSKKSLTVSVERLEKALKKTKFSQFTVSELLEEYFEHQLISKREQIEREKEERELRFRNIGMAYEGSKAGEWFQQVLQTKQAPYTLLKQDESKDAKWLEKNIPYLLCALEELPVWKKEKVRQAVFASKIAGSPHYFDDGTRMFRYLLYGICGVCQLPFPEKQTTEQKAEILYKAGILKDDISNFVTCIGIRGCLKNGEYHLGMEGYYARNEMQQLNLYHLGLLESVETKKDNVYVVENPAIFQALSDKDYYKEEAVVCANGQLRLAVIVLLDLLVQSGAILYYAGDFDPEGLMIAQKLKNRYHNRLKFWHYEREDFEVAKSNGDIISERRKKQLENLTDPVLLRMGQWILEYGAVGYQENMLERYLL
ncbi:MAG: DUF2399 domain-containing protein [Clostridiales bacterium]|nr:DUF2399 domain-containing protein [Clostridiales bacterium]